MELTVNIAGKLFISYYTSASVLPVSFRSNQEGGKNNENSIKIEKIIAYCLFMCII